MGVSRKEIDYILRKTFIEDWPKSTAKLGRNLMTEFTDKLEAVGKKDSKNKTRLDLVPTEAIEGLALALMDGLKKYNENNWRLGLPYSEIYGAAQRHLQKFWNTDKSDIDSESKLPHLYHAICNIAFLITYEENKERYRTFDDRVGGNNKPYPDLTKMTHPEACEHLEVGMRVKVLRAAEYNERGWNAIWYGEKMNSYIGNSYTIKGFTGSENVEFVEDNQAWVFPAFVLEIVSRPGGTE